MDTNALMFVLAIATLLAALGIGFWNKTRNRDAEKTNEHSALSQSRQGLTANSRGIEAAGGGPLAQWVKENR